METIITTLQERAEQSVVHLRQELGKLRTGRANLGLLDSVRVDVYGQQMPLNQLASLNIPEPRMITVQAWDSTNIAMIEKAILKAQLGLTPANDGVLIRLSIPPLTEERRKDIVKIVKRLGEDAKVSVRGARRDANESLKALEKDGECSEDDVKRVQGDVQKHTDKFVADIDATVEAKEKEVMTV